MCDSNSTTDQTSYDEDNMGPSTATASRKRTRITLEQRIDILKHLDNGKRVCDVARLFDLNESTIRSIRDKEQTNSGTKSKESGSLERINCSNLKRDPFLERMESALIIWLENCSRLQIPVTQNIIRDKAKALYDNTKKAFQDEYKIKYNINGKYQFVASKGWFRNFLTRNHNLNISFQQSSEIVIQNDSQQSEVVDEEKLSMLINEKTLKDKELVQLVYVRDKCKNDNSNQINNGIENQIPDPNIKQKRQLKQKINLKVSKNYNKSKSKKLFLKIDKKRNRLRKHITLAEKLHILDLLNSGYRNCQVAKRFNLNESSIRSIRRNESRIRELANINSSGSFMRMKSSPNDQMMDLMEKALTLWIDDCFQKQLPLKTILIRKKAKSIFDKMKQYGPNYFHIYSDPSENLDSPSNNTNDENCENSNQNQIIKAKEFVASKGWFTNFLKRNPRIQYKIKKYPLYDNNSNTLPNNKQTFIGQNDQNDQSIIDCNEQISFEFNQQQTKQMAASFNGEEEHENEDILDKILVENSLNNDELIFRIKNEQLSKNKFLTPDILKQIKEHAEILLKLLNDNDQDDQRLKMVKCSLEPYLELYRSSITTHAANHKD